jgi:PmbA protein
MEVEVYKEKSYTLSLTKTMAEQNCIEGRHEGIGVRVIENGRIGFGYDKEEEKAKQNAKKALSFSPISNFTFQPPNSFPSITCLDETIARCDWIGVIEEIERAIIDETKENKEIQLNYLSIEIGKYAKSISNTNGLDITWEGGSFSTYIYLTGKNGGSATRWLDTLSIPKIEKIKEIVRDGVKVVEEQKKRIKIDKQYPIAFSPYVFPSFLTFFLSNLNLKRIREKTSILHEKFDEVITSESLTIVDDGTTKGSNRAMADDEGVPSKRRVLIENGRVKGFYGDMYNNALYAGKYAGKGLRGFASRSSFATPPVPSLSNTLIEVKKEVEVANFEELGPFILIEDYHGLHTANQTTGDFNCSVTTAFLIENGKRKALFPFSISGNVFRMFKNIIAVEKNMDWFGSWFLAKMLFGGVDVVP